MASDLEFTLTKAIDVSGVRTFESSLGSRRMLGGVNMLFLLPLRQNQR
jgi:hypothetical protein